MRSVVDAAEPRHRHGVPGAVAGPQPHRRREHRARQRGARRASRPVPLGHHAQARAGAAGQDRLAPSTRWPAPTRSPSPTGRWSRSPRCCASSSAPSTPPVIILDEPTSVLESARSRPCSPRSAGCASSPPSSSSRTVSTRCSRCATGSRVLRGGQSVGDVATRGCRPGRPAPHDDRVDRLRRPLPRQLASSVRPGSRRPRLTVRGLSGPSFRDVDLDVARGGDPRDRRRPRLGARGRLPRAVRCASRRRCRRGHPRREEARPVRHPRGLRRRRRATCPPSARSRAWSGRCRSPTT